MASLEPADCCLVAVKHTGEPVGELKALGDIDIYYSYPKDKSTDKAILFLTDVFGLGLVNSRLIADQFAANGYFVAVPDLFNKDAIPLPRPDGFDIAKWRAGPPGHGPDTVDPIVSAVVSELRERHGVQRLGAVGYCFGAKYVVRFLRDGLVDVGYIAHPTLVTEDELQLIQGPLSIAAAEVDARFPQDLRIKSENILKQVGQPWQINLYSGCEHGFATKGDLSRPQVKFAREQAFLQAVYWFRQHL